ncbi:Phosphatidylinositol-3-phosphatase SAC1 [Nakaseomyces bracarensis]|uniref:Phosphatidylinositol-3-phosphatase SAC1 n=1 Tax=Nakaseomyces bracarensis TaxID=273131 RepID=A0ABR4NSD2_9SACH
MSGPLLFARNSEGLFFKAMREDGSIGAGAGAGSGAGSEGKGSGSGSGSGSVVHLSAHDQLVSAVSAGEFPVGSGTSRVAALLGFIRLKLNKYAVIADTVEETGRLNGHVVYRVVQHSVVSAKRSARIDSDEAEYLKLLEMQLKNATLYFSYTYDLTNSVQRNEQLKSGAMWTNCDNRFFWNHYITEELRGLAQEDQSVSRFVQPVIYGYAKIIDTGLNSVPINIGLITRRSILRAGTRYFRRGIDENGNVGNFNETEQILVVRKSGANPEVYSFLQTRGSVPVYWAEINNLKYKPSLVLGDNSTLEPTRKHFDEQIKLYGDNYLVNLVNQKGHELPVKESYEAAVAGLNNPKLHYVYFDFHHECRNMKWHRVKLLIDHLTELGLSNQDYFHKILSADGTTTEKVVNEQKSTVRTNCMDCLDRTNVVQSVLAHWVLQNEFETSGIIQKGEAWEQDKNLLVLLQNLWADNADAVSFSYSGTGALKTDFTRTGKRTKMGAFNDLVNSISRYYQNNLTDGPRQDSYDLFLGTFKPFSTGVVSPFTDRRPLIIQAIPIALYAALTVMGATILFPKGTFTNSKNLLYFVCASMTLAACFQFLIKNGIQYVNWPKLVDVGFLVAMQTHNKEQEFKGFKYKPDPRFKKPSTSKKD